MTTLTEHRQNMIDRADQIRWQDIVDNLRLTFEQRAAIARATGSATDAGYSTKDYSLTVRTRGGHLYALAMCRFDQPTETIRRALEIMSR